MTSLAFILGVVPLVFAAGAGAEMRQSLGTAVFSGMLGVTLFGLIFTPVFYVLVRGFAARRRPDAQSEPPVAPFTGQFLSHGARRVPIFTIANGTRRQSGPNFFLCPIVARAN